MKDLLQVSDRRNQTLLQGGLAHHRAGRLREAEQLYRQLLAIEPNHPDCLHLLGMTLFQMGDAEDASGLVRRAIALHPSGAAYHANLGNVLQFQQRDAEAESCYRTSLSLRPKQAEVWMNLGHLQKKRAQVDAALFCYEQALTIDPQLKEAEAAKATSLLLKGGFREGWELFEARWYTSEWSGRLRLDKFPRWRGEDVGTGLVLIWGEQGVGDEIMFAGLIPDVLARGVQCVVHCDARLVPLLARSFPEVMVISGDDPCQLAQLNIAAQLPCGSLPGLYRRTADEFAHVASPYLNADSSLREQLREKYNDGRPLVGIAWHTKSRATGLARSIDLAAFAPLLASENVRWIGLQYGGHEALRREIATSGGQIVLDQEIDQLQDMDSFAAQVAAMDLVVTIDNSTAHLAAALGVPTWVLLPPTSDWRWLFERTDSPWYPTMRLFRAIESCGWAPVVERVRSELLAAFPLI